MKTDEKKEQQPIAENWHIKIDAATKATISAAAAKEGKSAGELISAFLSFYEARKVAAPPSSVDKTEDEELTTRTRPAALAQVPEPAPRTDAPPPSIETMISLKKEQLLWRQKFPCEVTGCTSRAQTQSDKKRCSDHAALFEMEARIAAPTPPPIPASPERPDCEFCCNRRFVITAGESNVITAKNCDHCALSCPHCEHGQILTEVNGYDSWVDCSCKKAPIDRTLRALNRSEIPATYHAVLLGKLPLTTQAGLALHLSYSQMEAHKIAFRFALDYQQQLAKKKDGLFFHGPPGTGKTLALCRALALIAKTTARSVKYLHFPAYLDLRKQSFKNEELDIEAPAELTAPAVLVVDEILLQGRPGFPRSFSDWERSQFDLLVHGRWLAGKPTLYATNYSPAQIERELSEATYSRIKSTSLFLEVNGKDLR